MAITVNLQQLQKVQLQGSPYGTTDFFQVATLNLDSSYPSKGYAITPSQFGLNAILGMMQIAYGGAATPSLFIYDNVNNSLRVFVNTVTNTAALQVAGATLSQFIEVPVGYAGFANVSPTFLVVGF